MQKKPATPVGKTNTTTDVRNSAIPRVNAKPTVMTAPGRQISHEQIAERAYLISLSGNAGTQEENWLRAERELRQEMSRGFLGSTRR